MKQAWTRGRPGILYGFDIWGLFGVARRRKGDTHVARVLYIGAVVEDEWYLVVRQIVVGIHDGKPIRLAGLQHVEVPRDVGGVGAFAFGGYLRKPLDELVSKLGNGIASGVVPVEVGGLLPAGVAGYIGVGGGPGYQRAVTAGYVPHVRNRAALMQTCGSHTGRYSQLFIAAL